MDKLIKACIEELESTLGEMNSQQADEVVARVVKVLKALTEEKKD